MAKHLLVNLSIFHDLPLFSQEPFFPTFFTLLSIRLKPAPVLGLSPYFLFSKRV